MIARRTARLAAAALLVLSPAVGRGDGDGGFLIRPDVLLPIGDRPAEAAPSAEDVIRRFEAARASADRTKRAVDDALGRKAAPAPPNPAAGGPAESLLLVPEVLDLGKVYRTSDFGGKHVRYLGLTLRIVNRGGRPVTIRREDFRLATVAGPIEPGQHPNPALSLRVGGQIRSPEELTRTGPVEIPAGGVAAETLAFFDLPGGPGDVPAMTLRLPVGEAAAGGTVEVDLNDYALGLLDLSVERIGPADVLALLTVGGELTPVGAGSLTDVLGKLADGGAARAVVRWAVDAPPVESDLVVWLAQAADATGTAPYNDGQHPVVPAGLRELRLAELPKGTPALPGRLRTHETARQAVAAALGGVYAALPADALLREITAGDPLTKPAAVAAAGRLPADRLPFVIRLSADADPDVAAAAAAALGEFPDDRATARLTELAAAGPEPVRNAALETLAASRYPAAHRALRDLLARAEAGRPDAAAIAPERIVEVLSRHPRPAWATTLRRLAADAPPAVRGEALVALAKLGDDRLDDALRAAFADPDPRLRDRAFQLCAARTDPAGERMATDYMAEWLKDRPPTPAMEILVNRTRDPRAVSLLLDQLRRGIGDQAELVRLLAQNGGLEVRDALADAYPKLDRLAKPVVLDALGRMGSPKFLGYAADALASDDVGLLTTACARLGGETSPEAVRLLADALASDRKPAWPQAATALAAVGTVEARAALRSAMRSPEERRSLAATQAFQNLLRQSPALEAFLAGRAAAAAERWDEAAEKYSVAVDLDPLFVEAWTGRANARVQLKRHDDARSDYGEALKLDPDEPVAVACLGILDVLTGRVEEGLTFVRSRAALYPKDELFAYNTACLYSVAATKLRESDRPRSDRLLDDATTELGRAVALGFSDGEWMRQDPDLTPLRDRPEFAKLAAEADAKAKAEKAAAE